MDVSSLAAVGLVLASVVLGLVIRRSQSAQGQAFTTQVGDQVYSGHFQLRDGVLHVVCEQGSKSAPLGGKAPAQVAERLMAEIQAEASTAGSASG